VGGGDGKRRWVRRGSDRGAWGSDKESERGSDKGNHRCVGHGGKRWCRYRVTPTTAMRMAHALSPDTLSASWKRSDVERSQGWSASFGWMAVIRVDLDDARRPRIGWSRAREHKTRERAIDRLEHVARRSRLKQQLNTGGSVGENEVRVYIE
jgi:hypothetical protein